MKMEWARRGVLVLTGVAWGLMLVDALPWLPDFQAGEQGLIRVVAILGTVWLVVARARATPAEEIYQAGYESGYDAGRRAAAEHLRSKMADADPRR